MVCVIYDDGFLNHDTGSRHPESPARLRAVVDHLRSSARFRDLQWRSPQPVDETQAIAPDSTPLMAAILRAHTVEYGAQVRRLAQRGGGALDGDTPVSGASYGVALLAVQAWLDGLDYVLDGQSSQESAAFILARPPGHHACRDHGMGFCLFSNAAIAALEALTRPNIQRVAIVDWDVHHGNGTQDIVQAHHGQRLPHPPHHPVPSGAIAYCSLHQSPPSNPRSMGRSPVTSSRRDWVSHW